MIILGLLLIAAAAVFGIDLLIENSSARISPAPTIFGQSLGVTSGWVLFVIGALVGAAILLGLAMLVGSARRKTRRAAEHRRQRDRLEAERDRLADERDALVGRTQPSPQAQGREDALKGTRRGILHRRH
ncbi:hypothetical protein [Phaeacidiphilus oryzae]|uniref:hypothetical protein n=2 Tax=Phaeacidiphilus oryzae TaxID=348818 RepID=UPI000561B911|nr:hypothetical protein [Phaeacidiphilus oryzae]